MKDPPTPRGGLSVAALAVVLLVPLAVGWLVERLAYGEARATEAVIAPLRGVGPHEAATVKMAGLQAEEAMTPTATPTEQTVGATAVAAPKR